MYGRLGSEADKLVEHQLKTRERPTEIGTSGREGGLDEQPADVEDLRGAGLGAAGAVAGGDVGTGRYARGTHLAGTTLVLDTAGRHQDLGRHDLADGGLKVDGLGGRDHAGHLERVAGSDHEPEDVAALDHDARVLQVFAEPALLDPETQHLFGRLGKVGLERLHEGLPGHVVGPREEDLAGDEVVHAIAHGTGGEEVAAREVLDHPVGEEPVDAGVAEDLLEGRVGRGRRVEVQVRALAHLAAEARDGVVTNEVVTRGHAEAEVVGQPEGIRRRGRPPDLLAVLEGERVELGGALDLVGLHRLLVDPRAEEDLLTGVAGRHEEAQDLLRALGGHIEADQGLLGHEGLEHGTVPGADLGQLVGEHVLGADEGVEVLDVGALALVHPVDAALLRVVEGGLEVRRDVAPHDDHHPLLHEEVAVVLTETVGEVRAIDGPDVRDRDRRVQEQPLVEAAPEPHHGHLLGVDVVRDEAERRPHLDLARIGRFHQLHRKILTIRRTHYRRRHLTIFFYKKSNIIAKNIL